MALTDIKIVNALDYASGTADRTGAIVDMAGWTGIIAVVKFAAIADAATTSIKWQTGAAANMSDAADLTDSGMTVAGDDDNQIFASDLERPKERYVRVFVDKDTSNASAETAIYILYGPQGAVQQPISSDLANTVTTEHLFIPAEGTS